jgi:predicted kinase
LKKLGKLHLKNYDLLLEFKDALTEAEQREKAALKKKNMEIIERVYQRLRGDKEIQEEIKQIKAHPWVRVIEGG